MPRIPTRYTRLSSRTRCAVDYRSFHRGPSELPGHDPNIYPNVSHESLIASRGAGHFFVRGRSERGIGSLIWEHRESRGLIGVAWLKGSPRERPIGYRSMIPFRAILLRGLLFERGRDVRSRAFLDGDREIPLEIHRSQRRRSPVFSTLSSTRPSCGSSSGTRRLDNADETILGYWLDRGQRLQLLVQERIGKSEQ